MKSPNTGAKVKIRIDEINETVTRVARGVTIELDGIPMPMDGLMSTGGMPAAIKSILMDAMQSADHLFDAPPKDVVPSGSFDDTLVPPGADQIPAGSFDDTLVPPGVDQIPPGSFDDTAEAAAARADAEENLAKP